MDEFKQIIKDEVQRAIATMASSIPAHLHNGVDSLRIAPDLTSLKIVSTTTASTAPTDLAQEGTIRVHYDGSGIVVWIRANKKWNNASGSGTGGTLTHVSAGLGSSQTLSTTETVIFATENYDTLSEYDTSTGVFTASTAGYYTVSALITTVATGWSGGDYFGVEIKVNGTRVTLGFQVIEVTMTKIVAIPVVHTVYLSANDTVEISCVFIGPATVDTFASAARNQLTIDRLN